MTAKKSATAKYQRLIRKITAFRVRESIEEDGKWKT